jgi:hypothetical protein
MFYLWHHSCNYVDKHSDRRAGRRWIVTRHTERNGSGQMTGDQLRGGERPPSQGRRETGRQQRLSADADNR